MRSAHAALLAALVGCARPPAPPSHGAAPLARSWPEADALFHRDPRFHGGDAAYSIPLGAERTLWLFGDSFLGPTRKESAFVHNAIAIQSGLDPTRASFTVARAAGSFFAEDPDGAWAWPEHGALVDGHLVIFLSRVVRTGQDAFGFRTSGWRAVIADDVRDADPARWSFRPAQVDADPYPVVLGVAVAAHDDVVDVYAVREPGNHDVSLVRFARAAFAAGDLRGGRWFHDVMRSVGTELSVQRAAGGAWSAVSTEGFGATNVVVRTAPRPEGPWSPPRVVFRPPESGRANVFVYAAKAHPEIAAPEGTLAITYATNTNDLGALVADESLYYPRFALVPR